MQKGVASSLWQGVRAAFLLRPDARRIDGSVVVLCALFVFGVLVSAGAQLLWLDGRARVSWPALPSLFSELPFFLLAGWVAARRSVRGINALVFPVIGLAVAPAMNGLSWLAFRLASSSQMLWWALYWALIGWWILALALAYVRLVGRGVRYAGAGLLWILIIGAMSVFLPRSSLLVASYDGRQIPRYEPSIEREDAFHAQAGLLDERLKELKPQRPGVEDLYFAGFAGHASEDVFYKELQVIGPLMDQRFDTAGRSVMLVNNPKTVLQLPLATGTNLRRALRDIGQRIDREEDVVMVYLTSHGGSNHDFDVSFRPLQLTDITPASLKVMFDEAGIKWRIIVVSACYSGGYIGPLRDEHTLVMTAADATHTSFGCGSESDFTYFGRALFDEEMRKTHSMPDAFAKAIVTIRKREKEKELEPSNPQIALGGLMAEKLKRMAARLDAATPADKP